MILWARESRPIYRLLFTPQVLVITTPVDSLRGEVSSIQPGVNAQPLPGLEFAILFAIVGVGITILFSVIGVARFSA